MTNTPPTSSATAPLPPRLDEETFEARLHAAQKQLQEAQYKDAVDALSALVEHEMAYNEQNDMKVVTVSYWYGKALVELAKENSNLFGENKISKEIKEEELLKAENPNVFFKEPDFANAVIGENADEEEDTENADEEPGEDEQPENGEEEEQDVDGEETKAAAENLDQDFEDAWSVLEVARIRLDTLKSTKPTVEVQKLLAEVYLLLGDISLETEKFKDSAADYMKAMTTLQPIVPISDRSLAECCYKIAIAHEYDSEEAQALRYYAMAGASLMSRIKLLSDTLSTREHPLDKGKGKGKLTEDSSEGIKAELEELKALKPEIDEKIKEIRIAITQPKTNIKEMLDPGTSIGFGASSAAAPTTNDISSLIKKRKAEPLVSDTAKK